MAEADPAAIASEVSSMEESAAAAAAMEDEVSPASESPAPTDDQAPLKEAEDEPKAEEAAPPPSMGSSEADEISAAAPDHKRKLEDLEQPLEYEEAPEKKHEVIVPVDAAAADQASEEAGSDEVPSAVQKAPEIVTPVSVADPSVAVCVKRQRVDGETDESAFDEKNEVQNLEAPLVGNGQYPSIENTEDVPVENFQPSNSSFSQQGIIPSAEQQPPLQAITSSTKLEVPNNKVGVLIGKAGETIRVLQQNSGAKIQITRDAEADPSSSTRPVEIIGTLESINKAEQLIKDVIAEAEAGGSPALVARGFGNAQSGTEQHEILVPNEKVGMIIGKSGETIKNLQTRSGARIQLIPQHLPEGDESKERTVRVTGNKKQIETAKEMIKEVMNQVPRSSHRSYSQQTLRPGGPSPIPQWATRAPAPAQQPTGYDYQQRGTYPPQSTQYPQPYSSYPKQQPPRSSVSTGWEQRATTPVQTSGYDYYGQGGQAIDTQSSNPAPGLSPAPVNYNYGQSQAAAGYGQPSPYTQPAPVQQSYVHGYDEQQNYGQQQQYYGQQQQGAAAYAQQGGTPQQPGYAQQQTYGKPAAYGGAPQSYAPPRATSQPGDPMYQGGPAASYGPGGSTQQSYPYGQTAPSQQPAPGYCQAYGPTSGAVDGYTQPSAVGGYPQPASQVPPGYGSQPAPAYAQQVAQSGSYGLQQYPSSQPGYGDQAAPNNVSYGGYQGGPVDAGYGGSSVQNSGGYSSTPVGNQAGYGQVAAGYAQPQSYPSGYEHSMQQPQSGYGVSQQLQSGYGVGQQSGNTPAPVVGYTKGLSPQPGYGGQYDSVQMYGQQQH